MNDHSGYVYVIKKGDYYKIGRTKNLLRRKRQLQTAHAESVEFLYYKKFDDYVKVEKALHSIFSTSRYHGEWFRLSDENRSILDKIFGAKLLSETDKQRLERLELL